MKENDSVGTQRVSVLISETRAHSSIIKHILMKLLLACLVNSDVLVRNFCCTREVLELKIGSLALQ